MGTDAIAPPVAFLPNGLEISEGISFDQWRELGAQIRDSLHGHQWWIGDWLRFGGHKWGDKYEAAAEVLGMKPSSVKTYKSIAESYPELLTRVNNLSFTHHRLAASLPAASRRRYLTDAADNNWSASRLRSELANLPTVEPKTIPIRGESSIAASLDEISGERFGCIYADPPWQYGNQSTRASTDKHYDTMGTDALCAMPVENLAADDAHLHLWTTNAFLPESFRVIEAWGFEYRSCFVWVKPQMGIGNYWRLAHEFLLLGIRGDAKRFNNRSLRSWAEFERRKHSSKPEEVRGFIEAASPGPYLELFGRKPVEGWTVMGNQIDKRLFA
jgi:N6-adenosine-specific RNA methylase IME4